MSMRAPWVPIAWAFVLAFLIRLLIFAPAAAPDPPPTPTPPVAVAASSPISEEVEQFRRDQVYVRSLIEQENEIANNISIVRRAEERQAKADFQKLEDKMALRAQAEQLEQRRKQREAEEEQEKKLQRKKTDEEMVRLVNDHKNRTSPKPKPGGKKAPPPPTDPIDPPRDHPQDEEGEETEASIEAGLPKGWKLGDDTYRRLLRLAAKRPIFQLHPDPEPTPGGFKCTVEGGKCKYVMYMLPATKYLGEQFSQQRLAIMETIHMVKELGPEYVLVEPQFVITPHNNNLIEEQKRKNKMVNSEGILLGRYVMRANTVYDLVTLGRYFDHNMGVMLLEDFFELFGGSVPVVDVLFMDHGAPQQLESIKLPCVAANGLDVMQEMYNRTFHVKSTRCHHVVRSEGYPITACGAKQPKGGCTPPGIETRAAWKAFHKIQREALQKTLDRTWQVYGHYWFRSAISQKYFKWVDDETLDYLDIRRKLIPSHSIWAKVQRVVSKLKRPYVAMHIRRGDKLMADPLRSLHSAIKRINRVVEFTNSSSVFLMTDIHNEDDLREISRGMKFTNGIKRLYTPGLGGPARRDWRSEVEDMFIEMGVCSMADYFISSDRAFWASTTPSRDIIEMRNLIMGRSKWTTVWFGRPGERWVGPAIDTFTHSRDVLQ